MSNEIHCDYERAVMQVRVPVRHLKPVLRPTALHILLQRRQLQRTARLRPPQHSSQMPMATSRVQRKRAKQRISFLLLQTQVHFTKLKAKPWPLQKRQRRSANWLLLSMHHKGSGACLLGRLLCFNCLPCLSER